MANRLIRLPAGVSDVLVSPISLTRQARSSKPRLTTSFYYDPANKEDYTTNTCDIRTPSQSSRLAAWLAEDPGNHVTILAGNYTIDAAHPTADGKTNAGVRLTLLSQISGTVLASQVRLCAQPIDHLEVLENNASMMAGFYSDACPEGMTKQTV